MGWRVTHGVAIVGCGLIGQKRAKALQRDARVVACADVVRERAESLARATNAFVSTDWREVVKRDDVTLVVVATTNNLLAEVAIGALEAGKHVLAEKP
ncbi:MAG TPA: Gfo/Idh/MocA family oxidoreductase, partial [Thermoanaerobaculia bacterium]|nr:Gfo/Idh/MocA family oxidoreductase [Thermoanaerobaculia bacterium]